MSPLFFKAVLCWNCQHCMG